MPRLTSLLRCLPDFLLLAALTATAYAQQPPAHPDSSPHQVRFVSVEQGVQLELLDWGGNGRPLVFLSGLGDTAHAFDTFAPAFTAHYHVYGITRRGFGASSKPAPTDANYSADRLADDVLAVIAALHLDRPVLAGHSIAGEELSAIGSRYPDKVSGLIYLDAGDAYGYYDLTRGDPGLDMLDVRKRIEDLRDGATYNLRYVQTLLNSVSRLQLDLQQEDRRLAQLPPSPPPPPPTVIAIRFGEQKYTKIEPPVLAIFACPHNFDRAFQHGPFYNNPSAQAEMRAYDLTTCTAQAAAFQHGVPSARVIRLHDADHYIFRSNPSDVIHAINAFLAQLP